MSALLALSGPAQRRGRMSGSAAATPRRQLRAFAPEPWLRPDLEPEVLEPVLLGVFGEPEIAPRQVLPLRSAGGVDRGRCQQLSGLGSVGIGRGHYAPELLRVCLLTIPQVLPRGRVPGPCPTCGQMSAI